MLCEHQKDISSYAPFWRRPKAHPHCYTLSFLISVVSLWHWKDLTESVHVIFFKINIHVRPKWHLHPFGSKDLVYPVNASVLCYVPKIYIQSDFTNTSQIRIQIYWFHILHVLLICIFFLDLWQQINWAASLAVFLSFSMGKFFFTPQGYAAWKSFFKTLIE